MEDIDEMEEDEGLEQECISALRGATAAITPDSDMTSEQKRLAYFDTSWRLRVSMQYMYANALYTEYLSRYSMMGYYSRLL